MAAELGHAGLERHPRPQARVLEEHRQRPPGAAAASAWPPVGEVFGLEVEARAKTRSSSARLRSAKLTKSRPRRVSVGAAVEVTAGLASGRSGWHQPTVGRHVRVGRSVPTRASVPGHSRAPGHPGAFARGSCPARSPDLALGVLRRLAGPLEAVLLALLHPRVAGEEAGLAERQRGAPPGRAGGGPGRCRGGSRRPGRSRRRPRP